MAGLLVGLQNREALDPLVAEEFDFLMAALVGQFNNLSSALKTSTGNWTPVIGGTNGTTGQTYSVQLGRYLRFGDLVVCHFRAALTAAGTITGSVQLKGLPFTAASESIIGMAGHCFLSYMELMAANWITMGGYVVAGNTTVNMFGRTAAAASSTQPAAADIGNTTDWAGVVIYVAAPTT